jgi:hypothetical protein
MTDIEDAPFNRLPDPVRTYLAARASRDVDGALATFRPEAEVVDDGRTYRGTAAIRSFLTTAGAQFDYTTTLLGAERLDDAEWVAHHRIQGDFPGGVVDLAFRFEMADGRIARLHIAPDATPPAAAGRVDV